MRSESGCSVRVEYRPPVALAAGRANRVRPARPGTCNTTRAAGIDRTQRRTTNRSKWIYRRFAGDPEEPPRALSDMSLQNRNRSFEAASIAFCGAPGLRDTPVHQRTAQPEMLAIFWGLSCGPCDNDASL